MAHFNPVLSLENASTAEDEIKTLETLRQRLCPNYERKKCLEDQDPDAEYLKHACTDDVDCNPFPEKTPDDILTDQEQLNIFTFYLFERRYGWSEYISHADLVGSGKDVVSRPDSRTGRGGSFNTESKLKGRLNELLDEFLKWYLCQSKLSKKLLRSLSSAVTKASNLPVVRNQTIVHILDWLKVMARKGFEPSTFSLVKNFIVAGLTDVWSAIRNACAGRLSRIIDSFTIQQLECLFVELEQICQSKSSSWQAKEGAVMGMTAIIRSFHLRNMPANGDTSSSPKLQKFVKFGKECLTKLPEFITDSLYSVVFSLLAHPQLSIREHASKAFTSILSRSEFQYIEKSFQQVIIRLCKDTEVDMNNMSYEKLPHHALLREDFSFLDAYEAQGLLEVSVFLIKRIPVNLLMERWPLYFSTFNLYLMHPASTVRQASSMVFKYLVTKDTSSPSILRLVLQCLTENWGTTSNIDHAEDQTTALSRERHSNQGISASSNCYNDCNNYHAEAGGTAAKCKRLSINFISKLITGHDKHLLNSALSSTWEWREGRLLAYELILKYLIANHIHYVFPSYALSYSSRHASCSVDEAVLKRTRGMYSHHAVQAFSGRDSTSSSSLPASSSMEILEEGQNVSGRSSAPGTRKEKDESLNSNNSEVETRQTRTRTSSFTKQECPNQAPRLVRQRTVGVLPSKTQHQAIHRKQENNYFADSLLNRAKLMDCAEKEPGNIKAKNVSQAYERLKKETETAVKWMTSLHFHSVHGILSQILYQTMECLVDSRWELRRMGQQILPLVTETIRWFDITILEEFWSRCLTRSSPLFCYSGCITLKYSISHAGKLRQFIDQPPVTWKDIESCCSSAMNVFRSVDNGLQLWIPKVVNLLKNVSTYDKITVSALDVLITRQVFLPPDSRFQEEKHSTDALVCDVIISLFLKSHPDSPCALSLKNSFLHCSSQDKTLLFASDEFSGVSSKTVTVPEQARQAERFLMLELHHLLVTFIGSCRFDLQIVMLPLLVHSVHSFCDDTAITHSLVLSIVKVVDRLEEIKDTGRTDVTDFKDVDQFLDVAMFEFSFLITQRSIDLAVLKQLQEIFLTIFKHVDRPHYLKEVLQAVSTRLNYEPDLIPLVVANEDDDNVSFPELQLLSNDIPASPVTDSPLLQDDEDELPDEKVDCVIRESLALNSSHDSLANVGNDGHGREETGADPEEAFSDWDSIEEPLLDSAREALGEFIFQVRTILLSKENGGIYFDEELKKCGQADKKVIQSVLESFH